MIPIETACLDYITANETDEDGLPLLLLKSRRFG